MRPFFENINKYFHLCSRIRNKNPFSNLMEKFKPSKNKIKIGSSMNMLKKLEENVKGNQENIILLKALMMMRVISFQIHARKNVMLVEFDLILIDFISIINSFFFFKFYSENDKVIKEHLSIIMDHLIDLYQNPFEDESFFMIFSLMESNLKTYLKSEFRSLKPKINF